MSEKERLELAEYYTRHAGAGAPSWTVLDPRARVKWRKSWTKTRGGQP